MISLPALQSIVTLTQLERLRLVNCAQLTPELVDTILQLPRLRALDLSLYPHESFGATTTNTSLVLQDSLSYNSLSFTLGISIGKVEDSTPERTQVTEYACSRSQVLPQIISPKNKEPLQGTPRNIINNINSDVSVCSFPCFPREAILAVVLLQLWLKKGS